MKHLSIFLTLFFYLHLMSQAQSIVSSTDFAKWPITAIGKQHQFCDGMINDLLQKADGFTYDSQNTMGTWFKNMKSNLSQSDIQWISSANCEPTAYMQNSRWEEKEVLLYPHTIPTTSDANQTLVADCNTISLLGEFAYLYPKFIQHIIKKESNNSFAISAFSPKGEQITIRVSNKILCDGKGTILQVKGKDGKANWSTILEKAIMKYLQVFKGNSDITGFGAEQMTPIFTGDGRSFSIRPGLLRAHELKRMVTECLKHGLLVNGDFNKNDIPLDKHVTIAAHGHTFMLSPSDNVLFLVRNPWGHGDDDHVMKVTDNGIIPQLIDLRIISPGIARLFFDPKILVKGQ